MRVSPFIAAGILAVAGSAALAAPRSGAVAASTFGAHAHWCGGSPEFDLTGVPKGTAQLDFHMVDLDVPSYNHGGAQVAYQPGQNTIGCGEVSRAASGRFRGPSPPPGQVHTYRWTIKALDAGGKVVGQTTVQLRFPE